MELNSHFGNTKPISLYFETVLSDVILQITSKSQGRYLRESRALELRDVVKL
jgi:hypothetical protein